MTTIRFTVYGRPVQAGSKHARHVRRKDGSLVTKNGEPIIFPVVTNKKQAKQWSGAVRQVVGELRQGQPLLDGPVAVEVWFYFARPKSHYRKGGLLRDAAPAEHCQTPDLDKLLRCLGDSLSGVLLGDDKQIVSVSASRRWTSESERAEVFVTPLGG